MEEKRYLTGREVMERNGGKKGGRMREKVEGIKRGALPYVCHLFVSTPCNYDYEDDDKVFLF
jgi:hypothetical protein